MEGEEEGNVAMRWRGEEKCVRKVKRRRGES